ncbi:hypothetical protein Egran_04985 [Elaphomyces granulatus]|uniref:Uncharacterized protein n=1 Tax=Elaphomyces granulatus TaxID=519963 RepID=A0A232LTT5_9EURO|nr:hypothetical protein Egran_04985 [Elaphomyces granulatus]
MSLLDCDSERAYIELIDCLQGHDDETVRNWAQHRRHLFIRARLNKHCSLIPTEYYDSVRNITNAVEQTHFKSYATEKYTTLLGAILIPEQSINAMLISTMLVENSIFVTVTVTIRWAPAILTHLAREGMKYKA